MTRQRLSITTCVLIAFGLVACSGSSARPENTVPSPTSAPPAATPTSSQSPKDQAAAAALTAYDQYWQVSEQAEASPRAKDWRPELAKFMADPALTLYVKEIENLASVPAHAVGSYKRAPKVTSVSLGQPPRVVVIDCLDKTNEYLVSDKPGEAGKNLDNPDQPRRYEVEVQIVLYPNPDRWLLQMVQPRLEKPC